VKEKKDFKVEYTKDCLDSYRSPERFGEWSASYEFRVHSFSAALPGTYDWDWVWETDVDETNDEIPDKMYCVWVIYSDGDSFGRSTGNGQIVGLFKNGELAHELAKSILEGTYKPTGSHYVCWNGYFNRLESVEVELIPHSDAAVPSKKSYRK
jgi:hypothetical protein